jgi:hypothetical protein
MPHANTFSSAPDQSSLRSDDDILLDLLKAYEKAFETTREPDLKALCRDYPHLFEKLRDSILRRDVGSFYVDETVHVSPVAPVNFHSGISAVSQTSRYVDLDKPKAGAMGIVYTAQDPEFGREIAVKVMQPTLVGNPLALRQFRDEACITALLDHPGVVPILGMGKVAGTEQPFYSMRLLRGSSFKDAIEDLYRTGPESVFRQEAKFVQFRRLLSAFISICKTIDYAHQRAVIHCDLKPANIHIGRHGEAIVLDWGLARKYSRQHHHVQSPEVSVLLPTADDQSSSVSGGTPIFMSPEQAGGNTQLGPSSDIYGLGAILFVLITGDYPVQKDLPGSVVLENVRNHKLRLAKELNPAVPVDLEAICSKAMSFSPAERYPTAMGLAEDLERYLDDLPVQAREYSWREKWQRQMKQYAAMVVLGAGSLLVLLVMASIGLFALRQSSASEHQAKLRAQQALLDSTQMTAEMTSRLISKLTEERVRAATLFGKDPEIVQWLTTINQPDPTPEDRQKIQDFLYQLKNRDRIFSDQDSWSFFDAKGIQVARVPESKTIGTSMAHRDYFTGNGRELERGGNPELKHISQTYQSIVFRSYADNTFKTMISAPIFGPGLPGQKPFLGVVGIAVSLKDLIAECKSAANGSQEFLIIDFRPSRIEELTVEGTILYHSATVASHSTQELSAADFLRPQELERLKKLVAQSRSGGRRGGEVYLVEDFYDPATQKTADVAFSPISTSNHGREMDWGIVVYSAE